MSNRAAWPMQVITVALVLAYPLLLHFFVVKNASGPIGIALALLPLGGYALWLLRRPEQRRRNALIVLLVIALVAGAWMGKWLDFSAAYYFEHVLFNSIFFVLFGSSLLPGREPLITRLASRVHGGLPKEIAAYTVGVTWLWTIYFGATIVISLLLYFLAPLKVWSFFANVLQIPMVVALFIGEYWYRITFIRDFPHASIFAGMQAMVDHTDGKSNLK